MESVLSVANVSKSFQTSHGELTVLRDISFDLREGETCTIVGPSGSGKTTLLGLCAGLDQIDSGTISLCGQSLNALSQDDAAKLRNHRVGFVFQSFRLIPTLTALENVMIPAELAGERDSARRAESLLGSVGLSERLDHYPSQLSGGEQQRVGVARAFINNPTILFADEPTGNLDYETGEAVIRLLLDLNREAGTTLLIVTHNLDLARRTDRIIRLEAGAVVSDEHQPETVVS
ncbi:MAG: ABC transporter ATP-binding protein [Rhodothermales bacterium]|nr:ABC transporter ATP-binding protein [Rhodothermales bacterium]